MIIEFSKGQSILVIIKISPILIIDQAHIHGDVDKFVGFHDELL